MEKFAFSLMPRWGALSLALLALFFLGACGRNPEKSGEKIPEKKTADTTANQKKLRALSERIESQPDDPEAYFQRARLYLKQEEYQLAGQDIDQALSLDSTEGDYFYLKARVAREQKDVVKALKAAKKAEKLGYRQPGLYLQMGELFLIIREYQKAVDYLDKALKRDQFNARVYFLKGLAFEETGDTANALSNYRAATEIRLDYPDAYNHLARLNMEKSKHRLAMEYVNTGLRYAPQDPKLLFNRGLAYERMGQKDSAIKWFERSYQRDSSYHKTALNLGILYFNKRRYRQARPYFHKAAQLKPGLERAWFNYGRCLEFTGRYQKAIELQDKVINMGGKFAEKAEYAKKRTQRRMNYTPPPDTGSSAKDTASSS